MGKRKRGLYLLLRLNRWTLALAGGLCAAALLLVTVQAAAAPEESVAVPAVMYHAVLQDTSRHGRYTVSPQEFESDLQYLTSHGYTTVVMADLIAYTQGGTLPEKPVLITFDDGYYNNYVYAYPIAQQMGCRFVLSPVGIWADQYTETGEENAYYSHTVWEKLREMADSGTVELQNHSYNLHQTGKGRSGAKPLPGEDPGAYEALLTADLTRAQEDFTGHGCPAPTTFVYPYGAYAPSTQEIVRKLGFAATLTCEEKIARITRNPESLYGIGRFLRPSGISSQAFFENRMKLGQEE